MRHSRPLRSRKCFDGSCSIVISLELAALPPRSLTGNAGRGRLPAADQFDERRFVEVEPVLGPLLEIEHEFVALEAKHVAGEGGGLGKGAAQPLVRPTSVHSGS